MRESLSLSISRIAIEWFCIMSNWKKKKELCLLGQLGQICTIHPEDVQKMREFLLGQTLGTVELKLLKKGHYREYFWDALQKEER